MLCASCERDEAFFQDLLRRELAVQLSTYMASCTTDVQEAKSEIWNLQNKLQDHDRQIEALRKHQQIDCELQKPREPDQLLNFSRDSAESFGFIGTPMTTDDPASDSQPISGRKLALSDIQSHVLEEVNQVKHTVDTLTKRTHTCSRGVYGVVVRAAANSQMPVAYAILSVTLSGLFLFLEILMLFSIVIATSHPKCISNANCRAGEFCDFHADAGSSKVGHCRDCYSAGPSINASLWCAQTDRMHHNCDFLIDHLHVATISHVVVMAFVAIVLSFQIYQDTQQACNESIEFDAVAAQIIGTKRYKFLRVYVWVSTRIREFVIPVQVMGASAALLLNQPLTVQNIVLNGAGVGFILSVDDLIGELLPKHLREWAEPSHHIQSTIKHVDRVRLVARTVVYCCLLILMVIAPEPIMRVVGDETSVGGYPCSDIVNVCRDFPLLVGLVYALGSKAYLCVTRRESIKSSIKEIVCLIMLAGLLYRFLRFMWTKYLYLIAHDAFVPM